MSGTAPGYSGGCGQRLRRPGRTDGPAHVIRPRGGTVPRVRAAIARDVERVVVVANELRRIVVRRERGAGAALAGLWAERRVGAEDRGAVHRLPVELEVVVPQEVA